MTFERTEGFPLGGVHVTAEFDAGSVTPDGTPVGPGTLLGGTDSGIDVLGTGLAGGNPPVLLGDNLYVAAETDRGLGPVRAAPDGRLTVLDAIARGEAGGIAAATAPPPSGSGEARRSRSDAALTRCVP